MMKLLKISLFSLMVMLSSFSLKAQLLPTNLEITVLDEKGNIQPGASVKIYESEEDYKNDKNAINTGKTDEKGKIKFKKLKTQAYFVKAVKGDLNNDDGANQTSILVEKKTNKVNIIIEGFGTLKH
ncbi:SpaA isopeptide-forming pilin-related protein [Flexithrix dorotheae]|uniref:SpaA isopeptide-forming pilin-related protein n=1 Tax=Flexithrix dorotheae TaxID=70993 RepID=UPI0003819752|nr:SpaA isopeptide-forming pilin-related protein [Flexithrix dorotheae]